MDAAGAPKAFGDKMKEECPDLKNLIDSLPSLTLQDIVNVIAEEECGASGESGTQQDQFTNIEEVNRRSYCLDEVCESICPNVPQCLLLRKREIHGDENGSQSGTFYEFAAEKYEDLYAEMGEPNLLNGPPMGPPSFSVTGKPKGKMFFRIFTNTNGEVVNDLIQEIECPRELKAIHLFKLTEFLAQKLEVGVCKGNQRIAEAYQILEDNFTIFDILRNTVALKLEEGYYEHHGPDSSSDDDDEDEMEMMRISKPPPDEEFIVADSVKEFFEFTTKINKTVDILIDLVIDFNIKFKNKTDASKYNVRDRGENQECFYAENYKKFKFAENDEIKLNELKTLIKEIKSIHGTKESLIELCFPEVDQACAIPFNRGPLQIVEESLDFTMLGVAETFDRPIEHEPEEFVGIVEVIGAIVNICEGLEFDREHLPLIKYSLDSFKMSFVDLKMAIAKLNALLGTIREATEGKEANVTGERKKQSEEAARKQRELYTDLFGGNNVFH